MVAVCRLDGGSLSLVERTDTISILMEARGRDIATYSRNYNYEKCCERRLIKGWPKLVGAREERREPQERCS